MPGPYGFDSHCTFGSGTWQEPIPSHTIGPIVKMLLDLHGAGSRYQRIYRALRERILRGEYPAGARLPATRELARDLKVSRNVVLLAYEELISEGYCTARVGSGTVVSGALPEMK